MRPLSEKALRVRWMGGVPLRGSKQHVHRRTMQIVKLIDPTLPPLADECGGWRRVGERVWE